LSNIGFLGGAFNPPHSGHLYVCVEAKKLLGLSEVHLLVSCNHPTKPNIGYEERLQQAEQFFKPYEWIKLNKIEEQIKGINYSYKTLEKLAKWLKDENKTGVFLCGSDAFADITSWKNWQRAFATMPFAVFNRLIKPSKELLGYQTKWQQLQSASPPAWAMLPCDPHPAASSSLDNCKKIISSLEKGKAINPVVIDIAKKSDFADWMIVAEGRSYRHLKALAENLVVELKQHGAVPKMEGTSDWLLVDAGDAVVHLFHPQARGLYNLEQLWGGKS